MLLRGRRLADETSPTLNDRYFVGLDHRDAGDRVEQRHRRDPPVHAPPSGIERTRERADQPAQLRGCTARLPHFDRWLSSSEKGSASVRRIRVVSPVTS